MERRTCEEQGVPAKHIVRGNPDRGRNPLFPQIVQNALYFYRAFVIYICKLIKRHCYDTD